ncbi:MAG: hypothetical protein HY042_07390 [Spirochaetia bacterium]|nr:hypothetical protein [Spirochaetia bacterium]
MDPVQKRISLRLVDTTMRERLEKTFRELEEKLGIDGLGVALFTVVMELIGNAVKANLKRAYFRENNFSLIDHASYEKGVESFKKDYDLIQREKYVQALEALDLVVTVEVDLDHDRLLLFVENNALMLEEEEIRIRQKLAAAMDAKELIEFCTQYGDDMEGAGLGLAMVVFLIRQMGFDPQNFRVFREDGRTVARIEFPVNATYKTLRSREHKSHT